MTEKKKSSTPPVVVISGAEEFLKRQAVHRIMDAVLSGADRSLALSEYEGGSASLAEVLDDVRTLPFLTPCRLVVVREADKFITAFRGELEDYVAKPSATGVLLMECKSFPATTRLHKAVAAKGQVIKCEPPSKRELGSWLTEHARNVHNLQLDAKAMAMLCDWVGADLGLLDTELQKIALYLGQRHNVTAADVEALVGHSREEQVWDILSAVADGNPARAMTLWEEVWQTDKAAPGRAIAGIASTVRRLLNAKRAQESGASAGELARILWTDPRRVQEQLGAFSIARVERMLQRLLEADVAAKIGQRSVRSSIEAFIVEMARRPAGRAYG